MYYIGNKGSALRVGTISCFKKHALSLNRKLKAEVFLLNSNVFMVGFQSQRQPSSSSIIDSLD